jgi:hypothetical protein
MEKKWGFCGLFYEKQQFWTEYIQISSFKNKFSTLCKPKQNPKDQDKLNSIGMFYKYFNYFII